ncbi:MAG: glycosyltransferase [Rhizomicrobium sp.]
MSRVSVLIPSYMPDRRYLTRCFESLDAQTYRDFEAVVVDESDEKTVEFIRSIKTSFPVQIIRPKERLGLSGSLNLGVRSSRSEFIARLDTDDVCMPERLGAQVAFLDANPEICLVGSWAMKIGRNDEELGLRKYPVSSDEIRRQSGLWNPMCHPSIMLRRDFFQTYGEYGAHQAEDYELWLRALQRGARLANIDRVLLLYRIEAQNADSRPRYWRESLKLRVRYFQWNHLPMRLLGIALVGLATIVPPSRFEKIYKAFNRLR